MQESPKNPDPWGPSHASLGLSPTLPSFFSDPSPWHRSPSLPKFKANVSLKALVQSVVLCDLGERMDGWMDRWVNIWRANGWMGGWMYKWLD